jgi:hypothetical protein
VGSAGRGHVNVVAPVRVLLAIMQRQFTASFLRSGLE